MSQAAPEKEWSDLALVRSKQRDALGNPIIDPKTRQPLAYRLQENGLGHRRCSCKAWIFANYPGRQLPEGSDGRKPWLRNCKHLDDFKRRETEVQSMSPAAASYWQTARDIVDKMIETSMTVISAPGKAAMAVLLAEELALFKPVAGATVRTGHRLMIFDEEDD